MPIAEVLKAGVGQADVNVVDWDRVFSYEIRIYDTDGNKVAEITSGMKNVTVVGFNFMLLQNGGCGAFSFTLGEEFTQATIDDNYRVEFCFFTQPNPWFTGFITEVPERGTDTLYRYAGYGYFLQLDFVRVNETDTVGQDIAVIIDDILDDYVVPNTDIVEDTDKIDTSIYTLASTIEWERITAHSCFETLAELASGYEFGVDEERDFYFRAVDTTVRKRLWIGKHINEFKPVKDRSNLCNKLYIRCGRLTDGTDYVLYRENPASQAANGLREDVVRAPEFWPIFSTTDIALGGTASRDPAVGDPTKLNNDDPTDIWDGDPQDADDWIQVDLGAIYDNIAKVILDSEDDTARQYYARGFDIRVSDTVAGLADDASVVYSTIENSTIKPIITFTPRSGRYVRITLTVTDAIEWKVGELRIHQMETADVERWGDYIISQRKDIKKRATLTIKGIDKIIQQENTLSPFRPIGQWGIYDEDGNHINDYQVKSCKYSLSSGSFDLAVELGELEPSLSDQLRRWLQKQKEFDMSGVRNAGDLAGGVGSQPGIITQTMIGKNVIEVPHLRGQKISLYGGLVEMGEGVMQAGGHGFVVKDTSGYWRFQAGKLNADYGVTLRDADDEVTVELGKLQSIWKRIYSLDIVAGDLPVNAIDIPVDGNTDIGFLIRTMIIAAVTNTPTDYFICPNGDVAAANYCYQSSFSINGVAGGSEGVAHTGLACGITYVIGETTQGWHRMDARVVTGFDRVCIGQFSGRYRVGDMERIYNLASCWEDDAANITFLRIRSNVANAFGAGTHLEVWGRAT